MRFIFSFLFAIVVSVLIPFAALAGTLSLSLDGLTADQLTGVSVVVVRVGGDQPEVVYQSDGVAISTEGIEVADGTYHLYLEDKKTGLIVVEDNSGTGYVLAGSQTVTVSVADFAAKVEEVKAKDAEERERIEEQGSQGGGGTMAVGSGGSDGDEYAPGELLIRYAPWTTLMERYAFLSDLSAESRSKIEALGVYRVKVGEETNLEQVIEAYADDPRISFIEMNMVVSVPEPVVGDTER